VVHIGVRAARNAPENVVTLSGSKVTVLPASSALAASSAFTPPIPPSESTAARAALERRRVTNLCRIRKPFFRDGRNNVPTAKSVANTDSQQDGFFEAALQEIQPAFKDV